TDAFMKGGDSNTYPENFLPVSFLSPLGDPSYDPTVRGLSQPHPELVDTWQAFHDWFARISTDADVGWTSADVLAHLAGEVQATNAGIALVMVGTNDVFGNVSLTDFRRNMAKIVRTLEDLGVVPVLSTLPDIVYGGGQYQVDPYNQAIADV